MKPDTLTCEVVELKTLGSDEPAGTFEAIVAVFGNVDRGGDIVEPGAFKRTLSARNGRGLPPIVWSHNWDTPPIGVTTEAEETEKGLRIKGRLFVGEGEDSPVARQVYTAMKARDGRGKSPLREFSFGYQATEVGFKEVDGQEVRLIKHLDLFEVGPTLVGMNPATELVAVKNTTGALDDIRAALDEQQQRVAAINAASATVLSKAVAAAITASPPEGGKEEQEDNPDPNATQVADEDRATIGRLLGEMPSHAISTQENI